MVAARAARSKLRRRARRAAGRGFTLLEVLVAIAILGLGLTVILSSQAGLFTSTSRGQHLTVASNLLRCKMNEIELKLDQQGFQLTDEHDEGECCAEESEGYNCAWKIERVELPPLPPPSNDQNGAGPAGSAGPGGSAAPFGSAAPGVGSLGGLSLGTPASPGAPVALGALGALAGNLGAPPAGMTAASKNNDPGAMLSQLSQGASASGMEGMVMGLVYPTLQPMLEASIRRVTVKVTWREGRKERDLEATQFLTRPQEGMLGTSEQIGLDQTVGAMQGLMGVSNTSPVGTGTAASPTTGIRK